MDDYCPDPDALYEERTHLADEAAVGYDEWTQYDDDYWDDEEQAARWDDDYDYQEDPL